MVLKVTVFCAAQTVADLNDVGPTDRNLDRRWVIFSAMRFGAALIQSCAFRIFVIAVLLSVSPRGRCAWATLIAIADRLMVAMTVEQIRFLCGAIDVIAHESLATGNHIRRLRLDAGEMRQGERVGTTRQTVIALQAGNYGSSL
jgi:hypothetical protein